MGVRHLLCQNFVSGLAKGTEAWLHEGVVGKAVYGRLLLDDIWLLLVWVIDWLRLGDDAGLLVNYGLDLDMGC